MNELREALYTLRERWSRTLLTMSGVMAATIAIVLLASTAIGVRKDFTDSLTDLGVNNLIVLPGKVGESFNFNLGGASYLSKEIASELRTVKGVKSTSCWSFVGGAAEYQKKVASGFMVATTPSWFKMKTFELKEGRVMDARDEGKRVAVIGSIAAEDLFAKQPATGKKIKINGVEFEVIGVTMDKDSEDSLSAMGGFQNLIYTEYGELTSRVKKSQTDRILVEIDPNVEPTAIIEALKSKLSSKLDEGQFDILTQKDLLKVVYKFSDILQWLLIGLTSIALFIGGIGIMNVMLLSIGERTTEIGIRKAVGATQASIFKQFLFESIGISVVGCLAGNAFSWLVCSTVAHYTPINPIITLPTVLLSLGASVVTGVFFGLVPSLRASKKDPVRAIQNLS